MIHRLASGHLQSNGAKALGFLLAYALAVAMLVAAVGTRQGIGPEPSLARILIGHWLAGLFLLIGCVALLFVGIGRYLEMLERAAEFGILKALGASRGYVASLVCWEVALLAVPATLLGIALNLLIRLVVALLFWRVLAVEWAYPWWPAAGLLVYAVSCLGSLAAIPRALRNGLAEIAS